MNLLFLNEKKICKIVLLLETERAEAGKGDQYCLLNKNQIIFSSLFVLCDLLEF